MYKIIYADINMYCGVQDVNTWINADILIRDFLSDYSQTSYNVTLTFSSILLQMENETINVCVTTLLFF